MGLRPTGLGSVVAAGETTTVKVNHPAVADGDLEECANAGLQVAAGGGQRIGGTRRFRALV